MLWVDSRRGGERGEELAIRLESALAVSGGLAARLGMELGWIVTGLAHHVAAGGSETGDRLFTQALEQLLDANRAPSHLFRHFGASGWRRRFPNFATQIYSVLALSVVAGHGLDERALPAARALADLLIELAAARRRLAVALSTPSAARSSSATRSTRCIRTRWRRWR